MDMLRGVKLYPTVAQAWVADIGVARSTQLDYLKTMRRFQGRMDAAAGDVRYGEITPAMVRDFVETGDDGYPRSDRSRAKALGNLHSLFGWASDPELGYDRIGDPTARLFANKCSRRSPADVHQRVWMTAPQVRALIATTRGDGTNPLDARDVMMIALYLYTGLRVSELIRIRWRQVNFAAGEYGELVQVLRKGGKVTNVPLNEAARRELFAWRARVIEAVGPDIADLGIVPKTVSVVAGRSGLGITPCRNGFVTTPGQRKGDERRAACPVCHKVVRINLSGRLWEHGRRPEGDVTPRELRILWKQRVTAAVSVRARIALRAEAAGITHLRPHDLRRSFAGLLEANGASLSEIQAALGHEHSITTERYLKQRQKLASATASLDFG